MKDKLFWALALAFFAFVILVAVMNDAFPIGDWKNP